MYTVSTRTLSALAYDRGEEYDPGQPIAPGLLEELSLIEHARPLVGEDGSCERARQRRRSGSRPRICSPRRGRAGRSASPERAGRARLAAGLVTTADRPFVVRRSPFVMPSPGVRWGARRRVHYLMRIGGEMFTNTEATILVAEEDECTRAFLERNLRADGYRVLSAGDRAKALALLLTAHPDLIVVDVNGQTLELLDTVRSGEGIAGRADPDTPLIVLSGDADRLQRIRLLGRGGDDVVEKPFAYQELRARIGAVLRRSPATRRGRRLLRAGPVVIDVRSREVRVGEHRIKLSATEYELLLALAGDPHRVFTREELLRSVWGLDTFGRTRTLDSHASRLPRKLCHGGEEKLVVNVLGVGYRLMDAAATS